MSRRSTDSISTRECHLCFGMNCNVDFLFLFFKDFVCKTLSNEAVWQEKAEDALKRATEDSDSGECKLRGIECRFRQIFVQYYCEILEYFLKNFELAKTVENLYHIY